MEHPLRTSPPLDDLLRTLATAAPIGMFLVDEQGEMAWANVRYEELMGRDWRKLRGGRWLRTVHEDERADVAAAWERTLRERRDLSTRSRIVTPAGEERHVEALLRAVDDGGFAGWVGTLQDVTAERNARDALAAREAEFRLLAEHSGDALSRHGPDGSFRYASPAAEALTGHRPEVLLGRTPCELVHDEDRDAVLSFWRTAREERETRRSPAYRVRCADGEIRWFETAMRAADGGSVAVTRDVTERKEAELQLTRLALHDSLTGLPNRTLFLDRVALALRRTWRCRRPPTLAVLFIDVDRFKVINDSLGHAVGDRVLQQIATRLREGVPPGDTVARLGGDEFTVLCEEVEGRDEALAIAQWLAGRFGAPFALDAGEAFLDVSIGIALSGSPRDRPESLVGDADAAMYRAKESGRGQVMVFDGAMRARARERLELETALRRGVDRDELRLLYQPELDVETGALVGFEAVVRWAHPVRGLLAPSAFIPLAEEAGVIVPLGAWVLREACAEARRWRDAGADGLIVAVNVSARQLLQPDLVDVVSSALAASGVGGGALCVEITESAVMQRGPDTARTLAALKALGVTIAIDDFGTGYSPLAHLGHYPIDVLKIDRRFVTGIARMPREAAVAAAVISLAHALGLTTVAEGVETAEQLAVLADLGCDLCQGFLFAPPEPPEAARARISAGRSAR